MGTSARLAHAFGIVRRRQGRPSPTKIEHNKAYAAGTGTTSFPCAIGIGLWGFGIAAALGVVVGTLVGRSRLLDHLIEPTLEMLRPIPPLAFLPMMVLWFEPRTDGAGFVRLRKPGAERRGRIGPWRSR